MTPLIWIVGFALGLIFGLKTVLLVFAAVLVFIVTNYYWED